ncbi:Ig-like domain-containing protein [Candidatus Harpocratesius sp.]
MNSLNSSHKSERLLDDSTNMADFFSSKDIDRNYNKNNVDDNIISINPSSSSSEQNNSEKLILNHIKNPGFEDVSDEGYPNSYNRKYTSGYMNQNFSYSDMYYKGEYSCLIQAQGTNVSQANSYLSHSWNANQIFLSDSIIFDLDFFLKPNFCNYSGSSFFISFSLSNGVKNYYFNYYLHSYSYSASNTTETYYIFQNYSLNQWNHFNVNITDFFVNNIESSSGYYLYFLEFRCVSPKLAESINEVVIDECYLNDTTNVNYISNYDFESPNTWWYSMRYSPGKIETSEKKFTEGNRSLNISIANCYNNVFSNGIVYFGDYFSIQDEISPTKLNEVIISFDWFFHQEFGDTNQISYVSMYMLNNQGYRYIDIILGNYNSQIQYLNLSNHIYYYPSNFGIQDQWVHDTFDLFKLIDDAGWSNCTIYYIAFEMSLGHQVNSRIELLVDNFQLLISPIINPSFEYTWDLYSPFVGWFESQSTNYIDKTSDAFEGDWALNITSHSSIGVVYVYQTFNYAILDFPLSTNFWWRLDDFNDPNGYAYIRLTFNDTYELYYVIAKGSNHNFVNSSTKSYVFINNMNNTGSWQHLVRNLTNDLNASFGNFVWILSNVAIYVFSTSGNRVSLIVDNLYFIEKEPPQIHDIVFRNIPSYYRPAKLQINCSDNHSEILNVTLFYRVNTTWNYVIATVNSTYQQIYDVELPLFNYGVSVEYYIEVFDSSLNKKVDNNGGNFYTFIPIDDIPPNIQIMAPMNNSIISGNLDLKVISSDEGSGINRIEFYIQDELIGIDYSFPFEININTRIYENEMQNLTAKAFDNAGNTLMSEPIIVFFDNDFDTPILSDIIVNNTNPEAGQDVMVSVVAIDISQIINVTCFYSVNDNPWTYSLMSGDQNLYSIIFTNRIFGDIISFYIQATDIFNQTTLSGSQFSPYQIEFGDLTKPSIKIDGPSTSEILEGNQSFLIEAQDEGSGISHVEVVLNGTIYNITSNPYLFIWNTQNYKNGEYVIIFRAVDKAGNSIESTYTYNISNPKGIIQNAVSSIDSILQSYYGMLVGAGSVVMLITIFEIIKKARKKK